MERIRLLYLVGILHLVTELWQVEITIVEHVFISFGDKINNRYIVNLLKQTAANNLKDFLIIYRLHT